MQTVKNKTTVLILVFKEFLQTSILTLISVLYAKGYNYFALKNFRLTVPKNFVEETDCVSENFGSGKTLCLGGEYYDFLLKICCLTIPKNFVGELFFVSQNLWYRKKLWIRRGGGGYHGFQSKFFSHSAEKIPSGTLLIRVSENVR